MTTYNNTSISCIHPSHCNYFYRILTSTGGSNEIWFIGRAPAPEPYPHENSIKLESPYVSRHHACLRYSPNLDVWQIRHIGTTHPTWLNGTKLELNEWVSIPESAIAKFAINECKLVFSYFIDETIQSLPIDNVEQYLQLIKGTSEKTQPIAVVAEAELIKEPADDSHIKTPFWQVAFIDQLFDELSSLSNSKLIIYLMFFLAGFVIFLLYGAASLDPAILSPDQEAPHSLD